MNKLCGLLSFDVVKYKMLYQGSFYRIGKLVIYDKKSREDANSRKNEICRKRPRSAPECADGRMC
ncbi:MAG: hypothetical protein LUE96_02585 [Lachnospiraceae bacterium]|nr:hypothetical protein [Lachnospiraceae bacterium]